MRRRCTVHDGSLPECWNRSFVLIVDLGRTGPGRRKKSFTDILGLGPRREGNFQELFDYFDNGHASSAQEKDATQGRRAGDPHQKD